ncbi:AraC family transcriptional regulator [Stappia taiwanensis]|nr:AraC family transcriptional regulator [Stappia taiwanensis]
MRAIVILQFRNPFMPNWLKPRSRPRSVGILLFDGFSNHCLANAVEPLRAANGLAGTPLYQWRFLTLDGAPAISSSGLPVSPTGPLSDDIGGDLLMVICGYDHQTHATPACCDALRAAAHRFDKLAGFDTGSWLLAEAGLLEGRSATVHWQELQSFAERFTEVRVRRRRYVMDGDRLSCGGAMTAFDLMARLIGDQHGEALRLEVAWLLMHETVPLRDETIGSVGRSEAVRQAVEIMRGALEVPVSVEEIAERVGLTRRRLQDLFNEELGTSPARVYRRIRLLTARNLATDTRLSIAEIALRSGYADPSAMTRAFTAEFGETPSALRRVRPDRSVRATA